MDCEPKPEISCKSDSEEESECEGTSSGLDSSPNDDKQDIPIQTGGKFVINEVVARQKSLEEKRLQGKKP